VILYAVSRSILINAYSGHHFQEGRAGRMKASDLIPTPIAQVAEDCAFDCPPTNGAADFSSMSPLL
jgi:hypothetical protein